MQAIKLIIFIWVAFGTIQIQAQEKHFIYIQNESKQPFYVLLNKEMYSSTPGGFLIIPQLKAGKYDFATGFAKNQYPEQKFMIDLNRDAGFSLKQFGDKGWGLIDIQSLSTIMADDKDTASVNNNVQSVITTNETPRAEPLKKDNSQVHDSATSITAANTAIVNQPSSIEVKKDSVSAVKPEQLNSQTEVKKDAVTTAQAEKETSINEIKKDSVSTVTTEKGTTLVAEKVKLAIGKLRSSAPSSIVKTFAKLGNRGFDLIYIDKSGYKHDTIALFIPRGEKAIKTAPATLISVASVKLEKSNLIKCTVEATDEDFYKTRLHIAAATTESAMMLAARAAFKNKCFSTKQVKYLDVLFLSEESRLHFLELAKPYVYDAGNFSSLQSQFTEPEMIQKFKALLKKK